LFLEIYKHYEKFFTVQSSLINNINCHYPE